MPFAEVTPLTGVMPFMEVTPLTKVTPFNRSDAGDRCATFGRCDAFYGLYMLSIPLSKLNLFVDCT